MPRQTPKPDSLVRALAAAAEYEGMEAAFASACNAVAKRLGIRVPFQATAASPELKTAIELLDDASIRDPARVLGAAHESLLHRQGQGRSHARRRTGAYYTPPALVDFVLDAALEPMLTESEQKPRVLDPACGSGVFLVAALRRMMERPNRSPAGKPARPRRATLEACAQNIHGVDISPAAVLLARFSLWLECQGQVPMRVFERTIRCGDALLEPPAERFDVVVGNPPFLNQLQSATAHSRARAAQLLARYGEVAQRYADSAAIFLELGLRCVRAGGRVALVQPQSILASRDALAVRRSVAAGGHLTHLWIAHERIFAANVLVCIPVIRVGGPPPRNIERFVGLGFEPLPRLSARATRGETWAPLVAAAQGVPAFSLDQSGRTIGDLAVATADFRDQFYGLRGCIVEDDGKQNGEHPRLVTTGLIDPALCRWGKVPTRIDKQVWQRPRLDLGLLSRDPELARWARARLVPKILLATQTKILEAAVDEGGEWLPVTPLISVMPRAGVDIWLVAAALLSPVLTAWSVMHFAGAGLSASAIKLSARQVMGLPAPRPCPQWSMAASLVREASGAVEHATRRALLREAGHLMCSGYELEARLQRELITWWADRCPRRSEALPIALAPLPT